MKIADISIITGTFTISFVDGKWIIEDDKTGYDGHPYDITLSRLTKAVADPVPVSGQSLSASLLRLWPHWPWPPLLDVRVHCPGLRFRPVILPPFNPDNNNQDFVWSCDLNKLAPTEYHAGGNAPSS